MLIIIHVAVVAVLIRKDRKILASHPCLMYVMLFFAIVHANLLGTDLENVVISIIFNSLFGISIAAFVLKHFQPYRARRD